MNGSPKSKRSPPQPSARAAPAPAQRGLRIGACAWALAALAAGGTSMAAAPAPATIETPHRDPWVPPAALPAIPATPTTGAQLRAEAEQRLATAFAAADTGHKGTLTRDEARAAGLGFVARHFDEIDTARAGAVSFDDVSRYLVQRQAKAAAAPH